MLDDLRLLNVGTTLALTIYYDTENQWLYADWQGVYEPLTATLSAQLLVECLTRYPCDKLLNSTQRVTSDWIGQEQWAGETLFPLLAKLGIRYIACVYSKQLAARYSLDVTMEFTTRPVIVSFDDLATAYTWLQQNT